MNIEDLIREITNICNSETGSSPYDDISTVAWKDGKEDMADDIMEVIKKFKKDD